MNNLTILQPITEAAVQSLLHSVGIETNVFIAQSFEPLINNPINLSIRKAAPFHELENRLNALRFGLTLGQPEWRISHYNYHFETAGKVDELAARALSLHYMPRLKSRFDQVLCYYITSGMTLLAANIKAQVKVLELLGAETEDLELAREFIQLLSFSVPLKDMFYVCQRPETSIEGTHIRLRFADGTVVAGS
jgi:hypothetical protein